MTLRQPRKTLYRPQPPTQPSPDRYFSSDSSTSIHSSPSPRRRYISVLKYLPPARPILEGSEQIVEWMTDSCWAYGGTVPKVGNHIALKASDLTNNHGLPMVAHLQSLETTLDDHLKMKDKVCRQKSYGSIDEKQGLSRTLFHAYGQRVPYYSRFSNGIAPIKTGFRHSFATVLVPIADLEMPMSRGPAVTSEYQSRRSNLRDNYRGLPPTGSVQFDSNFESGNLLYAYRMESEYGKQIEVYDLVMQNDTNTRGHNQWFLFRIRNNKAGLRVRLNIVNFVKDESAFNYGIKPLTFSERNYNKHGIGWIRDGSRVSYEINTLTRDFNSNHHYTLSFQYYFRESNDCVYFAPNYPYFHSQLLAMLRNTIVERKRELDGLVSIQKLADTPINNKVVVVTIQTAARVTQPKKIVWIIGRQHPGETVSSFMAEAIIKHLTALVVEAKGKASVLDQYIFKIVPMLNVDGVIHGNSRAQLTGIDPNRAWKNTLRRIVPGVSALKKAILKSKEQTALVLDLHSHSKKTGCFFYGNSSVYQGLNQSLAYPSLVCKDDPRFTLKFCRFQGGYQTTARKVLYSALGIPSVYTVECSMLGYLSQNRLVQYNIRDYYEMGSKLIDTFMDYDKAEGSKVEHPQMYEFAEAGEARSESQLSDQEYEEIRRQFDRPKRVKQLFKSKRKKIESRERLSEMKMQSRKENVIPSAPEITIDSRRNNIGEVLHPEYVQCQRKRSLRQNSAAESIPRKKQTSIERPQEIKKVWTKTSKIKKMVNQTAIIESSNPMLPKSHRDKSIQVIQADLEKGQRPREAHRKKKDDDFLCIQGCSIDEQETMNTCKNNVCSQVTPDDIQSQFDKLANQQESSLPSISPSIEGNMSSNTIAFPSTQSNLPYPLLRPLNKIPNLNSGGGGGQKDSEKIVRVQCGIEMGLRRLAIGKSMQTRGRN